MTHAKKTRQSVIKGYGCYERSARAHWRRQGNMKTLRWEMQGGAWE